jgi:hypothetical protein
LPEEERQKIKDLLFILEKFNVSESAKREQTVFMELIEVKSLIWGQKGKLL